MLSSIHHNPDSRDQPIVCALDHVTHLIKLQPKKKKKKKNTATIHTTKNRPVYNYEIVKFFLKYEYNHT